MLATIDPCALLADVGTDHGRVPIAAVARGIAKRAIAADLRTEPLALARRHVEEAGVADRVTLVLGDGLRALGDAPVDAVVLAGMSGTLMARLCQEAPAVLARARQLIAQPNTGVEDLRAWARANGWWLTRERMIDSRGAAAPRARDRRSRFFVVCSFAPRAGADPAYEVPGFAAAALVHLGPLLITQRDPVALRWYQAQVRRIERLPRTPALEAELAVWRRGAQTAAEGASPDRGAAGGEGPAPLAALTRR